MNKIRPIPIGIEFYKKIVDGGYYYADKTLLIKDLIDQPAEVTLFTRPRRFGKTLAQTMLKTFFECEVNADGSVTDNSRYFDNTKIQSAGAEYMKHMGKYPVIFMSLKSAKQSTYDMAYSSLIDSIITEYDRHRYVLGCAELSEEYKERYRMILAKKAEPAAYAKALAFLSECLYKYHHENIIILLDEYDVPLENAYFNGFYDEMTGFIRSLFESALKTNERLKFAVVTGCLRISKESIFTGLNNLKVISVLDESFAEYFGFVQSEVDDMLREYGIMERIGEVREWYDGYLFGHTEVYNPWSVINYVYDIIMRNTEFPKPYWSNTSSNNIVRRLIEKADDDTKKEIERLIAGGTIEKQVHEDITYGDIDRTQENLWNFLFFTGYLKMTDKSFRERSISLTMKIPNEEILYIYENTIQDWFNQRIKTIDFSDFYSALMDGDCEAMERFLKARLMESISYLDSAESFYHGFVLGMLSALGGYEKCSNRESVEGRSDIILKPYDEEKPAIILELKNVRRFTEMEQMCEAALRQIDEKHYDAELIDEGYTRIVKYGICFCRKSCKVKKRDGR